MKRKNFGIQVVNSNGKQIVKWFDNNGYHNNMFGDAGNNSVYFIQDSNLECTDLLSLRLVGITIYTLDQMDTVIKEAVINNYELW